MNKIKQCGGLSHESSRWSKHARHRGTLPRRKESCARCIIEENTSDAYGGGAHVQDYFGAASTQGDFLNCAFRNNRVGPGWHLTAWGAAAYIASPSAKIRFVNCEASGNQAEWSGGAFAQKGGTVAVEFLGCTIVDNVSLHGHSGIYTSDAAVTIQGSIVWGNTTLSSESIHQGQLTGTTADFDVRLSCIEGPSVFPGTGNINLDPIFVNASLGDYRIAAGSPCIDAGRNGAIPNSDPADLDQDGNLTEELPLDFGGVTRRLDDPGTIDTGSGAAPVVDMGAHEFDPGVP